MGDQVYVISSIVLETVIAVKIKTIHQDMLSWLNIFEKRKVYSLGDIANEQKLRKFCDREKSDDVDITFWYHHNNNVFIF
jgi:hypothetical protein